MSAADLSGYRERPVYLRCSRHVPPHHGRAVVDGMEAFYAALSTEPSPAVRAVLGHFVFVFIHPFPDGNGRIARFLMNAMLASGGYPWTILRVGQRDQYMAALEQASVNREITDFTKFVAGEMAFSWSEELSDAEQVARR
jgi:Fic family protein